MKKINNIYPPNKRITILAIAISTFFVFNMCFSKPIPQEHIGKIIVSNVHELRNALNSIPEAGGTIFIKAGRYVLKDEIHIDRSNISLQGERGTILYLADNINKPVILIGTAKETPEADDVIRNISISNIEIDGNKEHQNSELTLLKPWIRNNGIDIRAVDNLWIINVDVHNARSGGIVASWKSTRIFISNSSFRNNYFDGIALYDSKDINVSNIICSDNERAGISLDNNLSHANFNGGFIKNNGDVGIFVRDSEHISFHNLHIEGNGNSGAFLSHRNDEYNHEIALPNTGVKNIFFNGSKFIDNNGFGIILSSQLIHSYDNVVASCVFSGNKLGSIKYPKNALLEASNIKIK